MSALYSPRLTASIADMLNIAVLISGGGSTLDNLIRRIRVTRDAGSIVCRDGGGNWAVVYWADEQQTSRTPRQVATPEAIRLECGRKAHKTRLG